jgi:hypothetical protein
MLLEWSNKKNEINGACSMRDREDKCVQSEAGKLERKRAVERPRRR